MTNTIASLWNGDIGKAGSKNYEMRDLEEMMQSVMGKYEKTVTDEQRERFQTFLEMVERYIAVSTEQAFCDGYRLGTKLTAEALLDEE